MAVNIKTGVVVVIAHNENKSHLLKQLNLENASDRFFGWEGNSGKLLFTYANTLSQMNTSIPLSTIFQSHKETLTENSHPLTLVFDDVKSLASLNDSKTLREHLPTTKADHSKLIFAAERLTDVIPSIQANADYVFLGVQATHHLDVIWNKFFRVAIPDYSRFYELYLETVTPYTYLVLDVSAADCYQFTVNDQVTGKLPEFNWNFKSRLLFPYSIQIRASPPIKTPKKTSCLMGVANWLRNCWNALLS